MAGIKFKIQNQQGAASRQANARQNNNPNDVDEDLQLSNNDFWEKFLAEYNQWNNSDSDEEQIAENTVKTFVHSYGDAFRPLSFLKQDDNREGQFKHFKKLSNSFTLVQPRQQQDGPAIIQAHQKPQDLGRPIVHYALKSDSIEQVSGPTTPVEARDMVQQLAAHSRAMFTRWSDGSKPKIEITGSLNERRLIHLAIKEYNQNVPEEYKIEAKGGLHSIKNPIADKQWQTYIDNNPYTGPDVNAVPATQTASTPNSVPIPQLQEIMPAVVQSGTIPGLPPHIVEAMRDAALNPQPAPIPSAVTPPANPFEGISPTDLVGPQLPQQDQQPQASASVEPVAPTTDTSTISMADLPTPQKAAQQIKDLVDRMGALGKGDAANSEAQVDLTKSNFDDAAKDTSSATENSKLAGIFEPEVIEQLREALTAIHSDVSSSGKSDIAIDKTLALRFQKAVKESNGEVPKTKATDFLKNIVRTINETYGTEIKAEDLIATYEAKVLEQAKTKPLLLTHDKVA